MQSIFATIQSLPKRAAVRQATWVYVGSVANNVALLAVSALLGRTLSPELFGLFSLALLVLGAATDFADFGLNAGLLRFASRYHVEKETSRMQTVLALVWRWRIILTILLTGLGVLLAEPVATLIFRQPAATSFLRLAFLGIGGVMFLAVVSTYVQAVQRFTLSATLQASKGLVRLAVVGVLLIAGVHSLTWLLGAYVAVPWLLFACLYWVIPSPYRSLGLTAEPATVAHIRRTLVRFSFWITVWSFLTVISSRVDQLFISRYLGLSEVALYAVGMQFIVVFTFGLQSISAVLSPKINALTTKADIRAFAFRVTKWMLPLTFIVGLIIFPSRYLLPLFFGATYAPAMSIYTSLAFVYLLNFPLVSLSLIITAFNATEFTAVSSVVQMVIAVVGNILFIPLYGIMGAVITFAVVIVVTQVYNLCVVWYLFRSRELPQL